MNLNETDFLKMDSRFRANLFNTITGYKSANLIGTINSEGITNLAIFNSVIHLGANPPFMGFILRPTSVERHTYNNILDTSYYTINHIHREIIKSAHHTSAKYDASISEFHKSKLEEKYHGNFKAPYVAESTIQIGLKYSSSYLINENNTRMVVGEVKELHIPQHFIESSGHIDLPNAQTVAILGLDTYCEANILERLAYAKPK